MPAITQDSVVPTASPAILPGAEFERSLQIILASDGVEIPTLPAVAIEVERLTADADDSSPIKLAQLIQRDVSLAGQIMKVANSALYARRAPVVSLQQAIAWLGMREIRGIAYSFAVRGSLFRAGGLTAQVAALWHESVGVACFAQEIARLKRRNVESSYLCGLLHRAGYALLLARLSKTAIPKAVLTPDVLAQYGARAEAQLGARLAQVWQLPAPVTASIAHWRMPAEASESRQDVLRVVVARAFAAQLEASAPAELLGVDMETLSELSLYPEDIATLLEKSAAIRNTVASFQ